MKQLIAGIALILTLNVTFAQTDGVPGKGKKVYVETKSKNENAIKVKNTLAEKLSEWSYWKVVDKPSQADFIISTETTASKGITATSWGGTSHQLVAKLMDKDGDVIWESNAYKASPNGTNGFNAGDAVVKKLMRDLKKEAKD